MLDPWFFPRIRCSSDKLRRRRRVGVGRRMGRFGILCFPLKKYDILYERLLYRNAAVGMSHEKDWKVSLRRLWVRRVRGWLLGVSEAKNRGSELLGMFPCSIRGRTFCGAILRHCAAEEEVPQLPTRYKSSRRCACGVRWLGCVVVVKVPEE